MNREQLIEKVMQKKEFSQLPKEDVELVFDRFDKKIYVDSEKVKLTRDLLRKMYTAFVSGKLLQIKDKEPEWILRKHLSTRERLPYYEEVYRKLLNGFNKQIVIFDLGCGVNGFSFNYFKQAGYVVDYFGIEAVGQLVKSTNNYFSQQKINAKVIHESLFNLKKIRGIIQEGKGAHHSGTPKNLNKRFLQEAKVVFLFKTLDSLEMLKKDYSKEFLKEIMPLVDRVIVSFATRSLISGRKFKVRRNWIINFIKENFKILDDFELGGERYVIFKG